MADYAISNVPRRVVYAASGVGPYAFTFEILNQTDIAVYKASTLLTLTTDYTVTINANGTGSVTLVTSAGTSNITIVGAKNIQRTTDFTTGGDLFANTLNDELDNQTIYIQQVAETAERGLKAPVTDPTDIAMTLPAKDGRKGKVLAFDSTTGNPVAGPALDAVVTVIEQSNNINTVAANIGSVNTVAGNTSNINTVAGVSSNVTTVATNIANVNAVGADLLEPTSEINTVAVDIANVNNVGTNISNVNSVAGNETNINAVVSNATNINAVAGNSSNINTVATNNANVTTVATNIASVNTNATNIANINQNAANIVAIQGASANATAAAASATAAAGSATSASASAAAASAVALGNEPVRHSVRPSLLLDFANTKTLDPRITFTRASTATFYDGKTTVKAEENLVLSSQDFDQAIWGKTRATVTTNSTTAPDGTTTADSLLQATGQTVSGVAQQAVTAIAGDYVISVHAKPNGKNFIILSENIGTGSARNTWFNLSTGAVGTANAGHTATITASTNGFYRCSIRITTNAARSGTVFVYVADTDNSTTVADDTLGVYLWGAQLEQRSSVTAYTATTTAPITNYIPALQTAAAGVARFEHNPVTGESLGLEIEEQRTNLVTYSEQFDNAAWTKGAASIQSNTIVAPDGTLTGDKLVEDSTNAYHRVNQLGLSSAGYMATVYAKAGERRYLQIASGSATNIYANFDLLTGTVTANGAQAIPSITSVGNGWYRCGIQTTTAFSFYVVSQISGTAAWLTAYTGDGFSGLYIWGAQVEAGAFATSYIPTVASQVTRSGDSASMTGTNFSSWYRADEGTLYAEGLSAVGNGASANQMIASIGDGAVAQNQVTMYRNAVATLTQLTQSSGVTVANLGSGLTAANSTNYKFVTGSKVNDFTYSVNANTVQTDTSGAVPINVNKLDIGNWHVSGTGNWNSTIKKLAYYPKRLTNAELQGLTTV